MLQEPEHVDLGAVLEELAVGEAVKVHKVTVIALPVGAIPMRSPVCVPEKLPRSATRSPISKVSWIVCVPSGKAAGAS